jgi:hypothetical protein
MYIQGPHIHIQFYILYSIFYILYSIFYILYYIFYILYSIFYILYSIFYILYSIFYILYILYILFIYIYCIHIYTHIYRSIESLKQWLQVNDSYRGTLSSYCYVLMCIHHLQNRDTPILPCLQAIQPPTQIRFHFCSILVGQTCSPKQTRIRVVIAAPIHQVPFRLHLLHSQSAYYNHPVFLITGR